MKKLINFFKEEDGATAVEYGIMVACIAAVIVIIVTSVGQSVRDSFVVVDDALQAIVAEAPPAP
ncbi:MAG TPA: Flp family type IVb pilin [Anaerolineae bacterium]|nr:Flp family type IVb pilin [Anaerolineae bacterium]